LRGECIAWATCGVEQSYEVNGLRHAGWDEGSF